MATGHVKVYEDKRAGGPGIWAWLIPLAILLLLVGWFLLRRHEVAKTAGTPEAAAAARANGGLPELGSVHFATDQATLTPEDQATLTRAAEYMKQHPNAHLRLEGYTDAVGGNGHNLSLSERRALAVGQFLEGQGIQNSRLTGEGFGPENPVASNSTADGKADNRRVELFEQP